MGPKSLVLVTVDCLRADHVGFMGYARSTTPFLDSIATEGFVFPAAIVGGAPTYYSFPAILASRHPLSLGRDTLGIAPTEPTLTTALKSQSFATAAFIAGNPYLTSRFGYEQGFDVFKDFVSGEPASLPDGAEQMSLDEGWVTLLNRHLRNASVRLGAGKLYDELYFQYCQHWAAHEVESLSSLRRFPSADVILKEAMDWLDGLGGERFFLWIHFMDPHSPYYPTDEAFVAMGTHAVRPFRARYLNDSWNRSDLSTTRLAGYRTEVVDLYDAGVRWVDTQLALLVEHLRQSGLWKDCIFTVTADHGEEFLDHGGRYHPPLSLREELIRVPLFLRVPAVQGRPVTNSAFSLVHLAPTLLDALRVQAPTTFRGASFWQKIQRGSSCGEPAIAECVQGCTNPFKTHNRMGARVLAVRDVRYKLLLHFHPQSEALYDLMEDPGETSPLPSTVAREARGRLLGYARAHVQQSIVGRDPEIRLRSRLRDLRLECAQPARVSSAIEEGEIDRVSR